MSLYRPVISLTSCSLSLIFFNEPATTEIYTLSLHDALPICTITVASVQGDGHYLAAGAAGFEDGTLNYRSEEHTSELQSRSDLVCRLLLEKKNQQLARVVEIALHPAHILRRHDHIHLILVLP